MKEAVRRAAPAIAPIELRQAVRLALRDEEPPASRWEGVLRNPRSVGLLAAAVGAAVWFLAGGVSHPLFPTRPHSGPVDDGIAPYRRGLPLHYTASDLGLGQQWLQGPPGFSPPVPRLPPGPAPRSARLF